jgi:hypothetical protein
MIQNKVVEMAPKLMEVRKLFCFPPEENSEFIYLDLKQEARMISQKGPIFLEITMRGK